MKRLTIWGSRTSEGLQPDAYGEDKKKTRSTQKVEPKSEVKSEPERHEYIVFTWYDNGTENGTTMYVGNKKRSTFVESEAKHYFVTEDSIKATVKAMNSYRRYGWRYRRVG